MSRDSARYFIEKMIWKATKMRTETGFHKEPLKGCLKASLCCTVLHIIVY